MRLRKSFSKPSTVHFEFELETSRCRTSKLKLFLGGSLVLFIVSVSPPRQKQPLHPVKLSQSMRDHQVVR